jgi:hypothetical protein
MATDDFERLVKRCPPLLKDMIPMLAARWICIDEKKVVHKSYALVHYYQCICETPRIAVCIYWLFKYSIILTGDLDFMNAKIFTATTFESY